MLPLPSLCATPIGPLPTGMVSTTTLLSSITDSVSEKRFVTYMLPLSALYAIPKGLSPTGMVSTTTLFSFITETVFEP